MRQFWRVFFRLLGLRRQKPDDGFGKNVSDLAALLFKGLVFVVLHWVIYPGRSKNEAGELTHRSHL
jgi:hypothetical protein